MITEVLSRNQYFFVTFVFILCLLIDRYFAVICITKAACELKYVRV